MHKSLVSLIAAALATAALAFVTQAAADKTCGGDDVDGLIALITPGSLAWRSVLDHRPPGLAGALTCEATSLACPRFHLVVKPASARLSSGCAGNSIHLVNATRLRVGISASGDSMRHALQRNYHDAGTVTHE